MNNAKANKLERLATRRKEIEAALARWEEDHGKSCRCVYCEELHARLRAVARLTLKYS